MALTPSSRLGPYEILSPLGAGGMGEVYRARDTRLGRDVALKVLPEAFAQHAERMARFQREAQVLASLNHPNIASIYGLEESGGVHALVMELVEGPTLEDRIRVAQGQPSGPVTLRGEEPPRRKAGVALPIEESLHIAKQIAEALEAAHEKNITHRDLKPANVKVTPEGAVKVLDFGLAKLADDGAAPGDPFSSPTIAAATTQAGMIMGTAAYMAPEQAKGKPVDRRADVWAFGCVLYEMLTGNQAFEGETVSEVLAAVIMKDPDWNAVPASTPVSIRKLLRRCLEKNPKRRLQAIGEARIVIEAPEEEGATDARHANVAIPQPILPHGLQWGIAGILLGALIGGAILRVMSSQAPPRRVQRFSIALPPGLSLSTPALTELALSPDGTNLVFSARQGDKTQLYKRPLEETEAKPIAGTEGGLVLGDISKRSMLSSGHEQTSRGSETHLRGCRRPATMEPRLDHSAALGVAGTHRIGRGARRIHD
jgi:eukaryotic-like serine/threonine-protein kinase